MTVKDLKKVLKNIPNDVEIYAFDKKVESYGVYNTVSDSGVKTQLKLKNFEGVQVLTDVEKVFFELKNRPELEIIHKFKCQAIYDITLLLNNVKN